MHSPTLHNACWFMCVMNCNLTFIKGFRLTPHSKLVHDKGFDIITAKQRQKSDDC